MDARAQLQRFDMPENEVILARVAEPDRISRALREAGQPVRMGQRIGSIDSSARPTTA